MGGLLMSLACLRSARANPDFTLLCAPCHGEAGRGDGPAADLMWPRPADLTGPLKYGPPERAVRLGLPGTMMPAFGDLPAARRTALLEFIARLGADPGPRVVAPTAPTPLPDPESGAALWTAQGCAGCHGASAERELQGSEFVEIFDGPLKGGDGAEELFVSLTRGRPGTLMVARPDLSVDARWALVAYIRHRRATRPAREQARRPRLPPAGAPAVAREALWRDRPTPALPTAVPILQSRRAAQCGRCHPKTHAEWATSRHALATGPGLTGQYLGQPASFAQGCDRCHAPQAAAPSEAAHADGVSCVGCHVRAQGKLVGPDAARASPPPGVPLVVEPRLTRSDFCMPCHNLPLAAAVEGRPLLDTWREWAQSPYLPAGIQCQTCHLGQGDHRMAGAHDPQAVRRAVDMRVEQPRIEDGALVVTVQVRNVGAGHHFPTTATPRAVLRVRQTNAQTRLTGTERLWAIGRTVARGAAGWREVADTRIPAGATLTRTYRVARAPGADAVEVDLHFFPDWFYTRVFRGQLARADLSDQARGAFESALADGEGSVIRVDWQVHPIAP